jgi:quercetin dioxygenase-like cupin family protein
VRSGSSPRRILVLAVILGAVAAFAACAQGPQPPRVPTRGACAMEQLLPARFELARRSCDSVSALGVESDARARGRSSGHSGVREQASAAWLSDQLPKCQAVAPAASKRCAVARRADVHQHERRIGHPRLPLRLLATGDRAGSGALSAPLRETEHVASLARVVAMSGEPIRVGDTAVQFLVTGSDSGGSAAIFEASIRARGRMPAPHSHDGFEETVYGLEGVSTWSVDGAAVDVAAGDALCIPRGAVHHFDNHGDVDAKVLCVITPALLGPEYFREVAAVFAASAGGPPETPCGATD